MLAQQNTKNRLDPSPHEGVGSVNKTNLLLVQTRVQELHYRRLRSLSTGAYWSNSGSMGAKKRAGAY